SGGGGELELEFRGGFAAAQVEEIAGAYARVLAAMAAAPEGGIGSWALLAEWQRQALLYEHNDSARAGLDGELVHELFAAQAGRAPRRPAVVCGGRRRTYGELERRANRLAGVLAGLGVGAEVPVGVHLERTPEMVIALLAVLKAGGAYVPLDTT